MPETGGPRRAILSRPFQRFLRACTLPLCLALLLAGCAERIIPVLVPLPAARVRPGGPQETLIMLPNNGQASVHLHFGYSGGRIAVTQVGIVNYFPDRAEVHPLRTRIYVDDGEPLSLREWRDFNSRRSNLDFHVLRDLPRGAKGQWLFPEIRPVTPSTLRGPTVVVVYSIDGHEGLAKIEYKAMWDVPG